MNRKFLIISLIVTLAAGFGGGFLYATRIQEQTPVIQKLVNQDQGQVKNVDFSQFWQVWNDLQDKYVDKSKLDVQKMVYGAISGMVNAVGDPYTVFFEPTTAKQFQQEISGSFGGVGMELGAKNNVLTVIAPIKDTPAYKARIQPGDKIVKIDGKSTAGMDVDVAVNMIRGPVGTKVTLTILDRKNATRDVPLVRATISVPTVEWKMLDQNGKHIAYMQVYEFNQNVDSQFKTATDEILKSNADGLIVDLRNNPGGLLDSAVNLAGYFVDKGQLVVSEVFGNGTKNNYDAEGDSSLEKLPTLVLVNGGSASASEILSGALHDDKRIRLIGEQTFGKGSVQELDDAGKGSSLKVTIAKWYTPGGINISLKGLTPDILVNLTDDQKTNLIIGDLTKDPQLQKALDVLAQ